MRTVYVLHRGNKSLQWFQSSLHARVFAALSGGGGVPIKSHFSSSMYDCRKANFVLFSACRLTGTT